jgi:hypothetical protein
VAVAAQIMQLYQQSLTQVGDVAANLCAVTVE